MSARRKSNAEAREHLVQCMHEFLVSGVSRQVLYHRRCGIDLSCNWLIDVVYAFLVQSPFRGSTGMRPQKRRGDKKGGGSAEKTAG